MNPFLRGLYIGREKRTHAEEECALPSDQDISAPLFDKGFYLKQFPGAKKPDNPLEHFLTQGWKDGLDPNDWFSTQLYLDRNPDVRTSGLNPFVHYLRHGRDEGRSPEVRNTENLLNDEEVVASEFDQDYYLAHFVDSQRPVDPLKHFMEQGWKDGLNPNDRFSVRYYLTHNPDVHAAGVNPFVHYLREGCRENRRNLPPTSAENRHKSVGSLQGQATLIYETQALATRPGPSYEGFEPDIGHGRDPLAKVLAYYLPQFHATPENDEFWGKGFTEWCNVSRAQPRLKDHIQPRIPRDLGFYNLGDPEVMRHQIMMARAAGVHGFCFYYYWFGGRRVLQKPVEHMLADKSLDFPFALMWANENWTRTWDGMEKEILLEQDYDLAKAEELVDDLARHFKDERYIRINGRPLLFIYRPGQIPNSAVTILEWRKLFESRHQDSPLIMMAQGFGDTDPKLYGLDGAIEFPPHKLCEGLLRTAPPETLLDPDFQGRVIQYEDVVERARSEPVPDHPLIRTTTPYWDNEARRPGRGTIIRGSTPGRFGNWMRQSIAFARKNPVYGEAIVAVNAWNEWAEGAYLEPDVHYGAAYLNALSRAVHGVSNLVETAARKLVLVGHDAHPHGAQILVANLARILSRRFGLEVVILLFEGGPMLAEYKMLCETHVLPKEAEAARPMAANLAERGFGQAIVNSTVSGPITPVLKDVGFHVTNLIHELGRLIDSYNLHDAARAVADHSDRVIFPAAVVRDSFLKAAGREIDDVAGQVDVSPQGLYKAHLLTIARQDGGIRAELGLPETTKLVLNVGYADLRKGFDQFLATAQSLCEHREDVCFVWLGGAAPEVELWFKPDAQSGGHVDRFRFVGFVKEVERWFAAADLLFLSAREDPFPSVVLEALATGMPVVGYAGTGGCDNLISKHGALVPKADHGAAARAIAALLDASGTEYERAAQARREEIEKNYRIEDYALSLLTCSPDASAPVRVSVIIPNYNYAHCLEERLRSIFQQTYPVFEIIVLDDCSTDNSVVVIEQVAKKASREIDLVVNSDNSGSPFKQWRRGLNRARGDYVWIAEADDIADPDFLETMMTRVREAGADLGFSDSWQIDETGQRLGNGYVDYANSIWGTGFENSFVMEGRDFLQRYLSVKNIILNVSSVVFRKEVLVTAMVRASKDLDTLKLAGDWRLYAEICATDGKIAYEVRALNGHRRHATSVTHALGTEHHLSEIAEMQDFVGSIIEIDSETAKAQEQHLSEARTHLTA